MWEVLNIANIAKIKTYDIANGSGIRTSVFFSGCTLNCKGCFNKDIQDFDVGKPFTREIYESEIKPTINEHIAGLSILGGDCFHPKNIVATSLLVSWFKRDFPNKTIWCWSGYRYEDIVSTKMYRGKGIDVDAPFASLVTLSQINVLVDGRFIEEQKDLTLKWRGSSNQRIIDIQKTLKKGKVILLED